MEGPTHRRRIDPVALRGQSPEAALEFGELLRIGPSLGAAFGGGLESLAGAVAGDGGDQASLFHVDQRGVDHARARRIVAARKRLDLADQFIAVARRLDDQGEQQSLQFGLIEQPLATTAAARTVRTTASAATFKAATEAAGKALPEPATKRSTGQPVQAVPAAVAAKHRAQVFGAFGHRGHHVLAPEAAFSTVTAASPSMTVAVVAI